MTNQDTEINNFVDQLYTNFLARDSEPGGKEFWFNAIKSGQSTAEQVTQSFIDSPEFAGNIIPLALLYQSAFNRIPDAGGLDFWHGVNRSGAATLQQISKEFVRSPEFVATYGDNLSNSDFVERLYHNVLGQAPDAVSKAVHVDFLDNYTGTGDVREIVLLKLSSELQLLGEKAASIKVILKYHGIIGAAPSQAQIDAALAENGLERDPEGLINELYLSNAYDGVRVPGISPELPDLTAPVFSSGNTATVEDNGSAGQEVYTAESTDDRSEVSYSIKNTADGRSFSIDSDSGDVSLIVAPNKDAYSFTVIARDSAGNTSEKTVNVAVTNEIVIAPIELSELSRGNDSRGFSITGVEDRPGEIVGKLVGSRVGDVNNDGIDDFAFGIPDYSPNGLVASGVAGIVFGGRGGAPITLNNLLAGQGGFAFEGSESFGRLGYSVSDAGDVNNDGIADFMVSERLGSVHVIFGKAGLNSVNLNDIESGQGGFSVELSSGDISSLGDVNHDGYDDILLGSISVDTNNPVSFFGGQSYVVYGKADGATVSMRGWDSGFSIGGYAVGADARNNSKNVGISLDGVGDVNGDGHNDFVLGSNLADNKAGATYVVFGTGHTNARGDTHLLADIEAEFTSGNKQDGFVIRGTDAGDESGYSVSAAGDVNNDGLADIIVGARYADPNGVNSGAAYVVFGKLDSRSIDLADIEAGRGGFVINGVSPDDRTGSSVSGIGDINGDGRDDLLIGAPSADPHAQISGISFVVYGKSSGSAIELSDIETGHGGFAIYGEALGDTAGGSVGAAGDLNNDGFADLFVGSNLRSELHIIYGGPELGLVGTATFDVDYAF